MSNVTEPN